MSFEGPEFQKVLSDNTITKEKIYELGAQFIEAAKDNSHKKYGFSSSAYCVTKALLNAYVRYVIGRITKPNQQVYTLCPGWCKTDMGTQEATSTAEQGTETTLYLIELPYQVNKDYQFKFFSNKELTEF